MKETVDVRETLEADTDISVSENDGGNNVHCTTPINVVDQVPKANGPVGMEATSCRT